LVPIGQEAEAVRNYLITQSKNMHEVMKMSKPDHGNSLA
jgi:hypothetical protein